MSDSEPYQPHRHYGQSLYRTDVTACGKWKSDVVVSYFPENVTCPVCIDELNLQADVEVTR